MPAIPLFLKQYWLPIAAAVIAAAVLVYVYTAGHDAGETGQVVEQQALEIDAQQSEAAAEEVAGTERVESAVRIEKQKTELRNVRQTESDPDRQRRLRGCVILRQQGRDTSRLSQCR